MTRLPVSLSGSLPSSSLEKLSPCDRSMNDDLSFHIPCARGNTYLIRFVYKAIIVHAGIEHEVRSVVWGDNSFIIGHEIYPQECGILGTTSWEVPCGLVKLVGKNLRWHMASIKAV